MEIKSELLVTALLLVSVLVFLFALLGKTKFTRVKNLVYALFVVCWLVVFIYLVVRVGAMIYVTIGSWFH
jgi:hypothetical protein